MQKKIIRDKGNCIVAVYVCNMFIAKYSFEEIISLLNFIKYCKQYILFNIFHQAVANKTAAYRIFKYSYLVIAT